MATGPSFLGTPKFTNIILNNTNAGDSAYLNPTTVATVLTMAAAGRIDTIYAVPTGANVSCIVRLWIDTVGSGGSNNKLLKEIAIAASASSPSVVNSAPVWSPGLVLPADSVLRATVAETGVTNGIALSVEFGEF